MERREFLQSTLVSAAATFLGVAPKANAATTLPFSKDNAMPNNIRTNPLPRRMQLSSCWTIRSD
jgi:hypothetical protein